MNKLFRVQSSVQRWWSADDDDEKEVEGDHDDDNDVDDDDMCVAVTITTLTTRGMRVGAVRARGRKSPTPPRTAWRHGTSMADWQRTLTDRCPDLARSWGPPAITWGEWPPCCLCMFCIYPWHCVRVFYVCSAFSLCTVFVFCVCSVVIYTVRSVLNGLQPLLVWISI
jgi:hypothetical protein